MASFFRWQVANKIIPYLIKGNEQKKNALSSVISSYVRVNYKSRREPQLLLSWNKLTKIVPEVENCITPEKLIRLLKNQGLPTAEGFTAIELSSSPLGFMFTVDKHVFSKIVLNEICNNDENIRKSSCLFHDTRLKKILVQCRLPAIGTIFSMNEFRNIIRSNFIVNINKLVGHDVIKSYTVPDWSLQAALLLTGYKEFGTEESFLENPTNHLIEVLKAAVIQYENDLNFKEKVSICFKQMESGLSNVTSEWYYLRKECLKQHELLFNKLSLDIDDICFDSSYCSEIKKVYEDLLKKNLISLELDDKVKIDLPENLSKKTSFCCQSTDSAIYQLCSTLYSTVQAKKTYNFDVAYLVTSSQEILFPLLFSLVEKLGFGWSDELHLIKLLNIPDFDMSKRNNLSAEDVLNQAKLSMVTNLENQLYLERNEDLENMAETLSYSSVHLFDLKHKKHDSYSLNWKRVLSFGQDSGAAFQLCHAGLKGLQEDTEFIYKVDIDTSPLLEPEAQQLILHLSRFDEAIYMSYKTLEPCYIYQYLSSLWYFVDKAANILKLDIKSDRLIAIKARLLLLSATLKIFQKSLNLLGLKPYENQYSQPKF